MYSFFSHIYTEESFTHRLLQNQAKAAKEWKRHEEHMLCWKDDKPVYVVGAEGKWGVTRSVAKLWPLGFDYICLSKVPPLSCRVHYIYTHAVRRICSLALTLSWNVWDVCELEIVGNRAGTWLLICKCDPTWDWDSGRERKRGKGASVSTRETDRQTNRKQKRKQAGRERVQSISISSTMEDFAVSFWIYIGVMSIFVGGAVKKFLAFNIGAMPSVVAWLGATLLVERLCALCMPAVLARLVLCVCCWLYFTWATPKPSLPVEDKAVFITGKQEPKQEQNEMNDYVCHSTFFVFFFWSVADSEDH